MEAVPYVTRPCPKSAGLAAGFAQRETQRRGEIPLLGDVRSVGDEVEADTPVAGTAGWKYFRFKDSDSVIGAVTVVAHTIDAGTRGVVARHEDAAG